MKKMDAISLVVLQDCGTCWLNHEPYTSNRFCFDHVYEIFDLISLIAVLSSELGLG